MPEQELPLFQKPSLADLLGNKIPQKVEGATRHVVSQSHAHLKIHQRFNLTLQNDADNFQILTEWVSYSDIYYMQFSPDLYQVYVIYTPQDNEIPFIIPQPPPL